MKKDNLHFTVKELKQTLIFKDIHPSPRYGDLIDVLMRELEINLEDAMSIADPILHWHCRWLEKDLKKKRDYWLPKNSIIQT